MTSLLLKQVFTKTSVKFYKKLGEKWVPWTGDLAECNTFKVDCEKSGIDPDVHVVCHAGEFHPLDKFSRQIYATDKIKYRVTHPLTQQSFVPRIVNGKKLLPNQRLVDIYRIEEGEKELIDEGEIYIKLDKFTADDGIDLIGEGRYTDIKSAKFESFFNGFVVGMSGTAAVAGALFWVNC